MPEGIIAEVEDGFATIDFVDRSLRGPGLSKLLEFGPETVETLTRSGPRRVYRVPEGNAREVGLLDAASEADADDADKDQDDKDSGAGDDTPTITDTPPIVGGDPIVPVEPDYPEGEPDIEWKFDQLKAYAADHEVDIDGARSKADVLAKIKEQSQ
ncbi:hypothetical protein SEA_ANARQUE_15 [Gordonia phage AnarQue]|nr:hypothetical protein SEA_ANARQUE_15 [Gordonia phage AnarQue]